MFEEKLFCSFDDNLDDVDQYYVDDDDFDNDDDDDDDEEIDRVDEQSIWRRSAERSHIKAYLTHMVAVVCIYMYTMHNIHIYITCTLYTLHKYQQGYRSHIKAYLTQKLICTILKTIQHMNVHK